MSEFEIVDLEPGVHIVGVVWPGEPRGSGRLVAEQIARIYEVPTRLVMRTRPPFKRNKHRYGA